MLKSKFSAASLYVQNGLIAMWDGIDNAGSGIHNPTLNAWIDIVGGIGDMHPYNKQHPVWLPNALRMDGSFNGLYAVSKLASPLTGTLTLNACMYAAKKIQAQHLCSATELNRSRVCFSME